MRKFLSVFAFCLLLPIFSLAEMSVLTDTDDISVGGTVHITVNGCENSDIKYDLFLNGKQVLAGEYGAEKTGAYRAREIGEYTLRVTSEDEKGKGNSAEAVFTVHEIPTCTLSCAQKSVRTGEAAVFSAEVNGSAEHYTYQWTVSMGQTIIDGYSGEETTFSYTPKVAGEMQVNVSVEDGRGSKCEASCGLTVEDGDGLSAQGDTSTFYAPGGIRTFVIHAPGVWTAEAEGDFILIDRNCGLDGDSISVCVASSTETRKGGVSLRCGDAVYTLPIIQSRENAEEEDVYLFENPDSVLVDELEETTWFDIEGKRTFTITASDSWTANSDAAFITYQSSGDTLTLATENNPSDQARTGVVTVSCGEKKAHIYVCQAPQSGGANVQNVQLSAAQGKAYEDTVFAQVITSADAETLTIYCGDDEIQYDEATLTEDGLEWQIEIPLSGSGRQMLLFSAENSAGTGVRQVSEVDVIGEDAGFADASAQKTNGEISVLVRAATQNIEVLDAKSKVIFTCTAENALIDRYIDEDNKGRNAKWTFSVAEDLIPEKLRIGENTVNISARVQPTVPILVYDQSDGWWKDRPYGSSTLEHSGCAIFALSHALEKLGFTGDEITPEALAKKYAFCLVDGGTLNSTLVGNAGDDLGFKTRYDLYTAEGDVLRKLEQGAVFTFSVVSGHIAMVDGVSEDGSKFHIVDSALSATFTRIKNSSLYIRSEAGAFTAISALSQIPGAIYFIENNAYGGGEYWLDASYVLKRGVRLVQPE